MKAIVPGSYDPVTLGHLDIIKRAAQKYDEVYAAVFVNPEKKYRFPLQDREKMLALATENINNVKVTSSEGLVIDFMRENNIDIIVKGYRNDTDLEYERRQAEWNKQNGGFDTELLECSKGLESVSSTKARAALEGNTGTQGLLPDKVREYIEKR